MTRGEVLRDAAANAWWIASALADDLPPRVRVFRQWSRLWPHFRRLALAAGVNVSEEEALQVTRGRLDAFSSPQLSDEAAGPLCFCLTREEWQGLAAPLVESLLEKARELHEGLQPDDALARGACSQAETKNDPTR